MSWGAAQRSVKFRAKDRAKDQGFVLVNALVLVAALAAVATLLLSRAEQGRSRLEAGLVADQLSLSLDGFDALALSLLARDSGDSDHLREPWAKPRPPLALARGEVAGQIQDLQGRFNVNWLSQTDTPLAQAAFVRLLARLGLPARIADDIRRFVTPGAELADRQRWLQRDPPLDPVGGPLLSADQLADLPGLSPRAYARLRPLITALPGDSRLNVNTAPLRCWQVFCPICPAPCWPSCCASATGTVLPRSKNFSPPRGCSRPKTTSQTAPQATPKTAPRTTASPRPWGQSRSRSAPSGFASTARPGWPGTGPAG